MYGFIYLNSIAYKEMDDFIENEILETLKLLNDEKLFQINKTWLDIHDNRENIMIQNIYDYCKKHNFERGLFYIGAAFDPGKAY